MWYIAKRAVSYFEIQALEGDSGSQQEAQSPEPTPVQSFVEGSPAKHHDLSLRLPVVLVLK